MAHVEKRGPKRYRARYRAPDGRERSKTFERRIDAERWLAEVTTEQLRGSWVEPKLGRTTFAEWVKTWELTQFHIRPTTRDVQQRDLKLHLLPRFGRWPLSKITRADVQAMVADQINEGRLSAGSTRRHTILLRSILEAAVLDGRLGRNPCQGVKLPPNRSRPMRFLEPDEISRLTTAMPFHYRPLVLTAAWLGLRWGELVGLKVEKVDLLRRKVTIDEQLTEIGGRVAYGPPKTRAGVRTVSIPGTLAEIISGHFAQPVVKETGLAFPGPTGAFLRRSNFRRIWTGALTRAGFDGTRLDSLVFHELRHTAAALAIAQGAHPMAIKERLGHASITITMDRYGGLFPRLDETIADRLDEAMRESLAAPPRPDTASVTQIARSRS